MLKVVCLIEHTYRRSTDTKIWLESMKRSYKANE